MQMRRPAHVAGVANVAEQVPLFDLTGTVVYALLAIEVATDSVGGLHMGIFDHFVRAMLDIEAVARPRIARDVCATLAGDAAPKGLRIERNVLATMHYVSIRHGVDRRSPCPVVRIGVATEQLAVAVGF